MLVKLVAQKLAEVKQTRQFTYFFFIGSNGGVPLHDFYWTQTGGSKSVGIKKGSCYSTKDWTNPIHLKVK